MYEVWEYSYLLERPPPQRRTFRTCRTSRSRSPDPPSFRLWSKRNVSWKSLVPYISSHLSRVLSWRERHRSAPDERSSLSLEASLHERSCCPILYKYPAQRIYYSRYYVHSSCSGALPPNNDMPFCEPSALIPTCATHFFLPLLTQKKTQVKAATDSSGWRELEWGGAASISHLPFRKCVCEREATGDCNSSRT